MELLITQNAARDRMDLAADLDARLPRTRAGLAAGVIDGDRAHAIWLCTGSLSDDDNAAAADEILAGAAPGLRYDQLARKAAALEMKLDPEAARARREKARLDAGRVEVRREASGNASLSGRELGLAGVLSAKANVDALAVVLRRSGAAGTLRELRVRVYMDLLQGRDPLGRPAPATGQDQRGEPGSCDEDGKDADHGQNAPGAPGDRDPGVGDPGVGDPDATDQGYAYRGTPGGGRPPSGCPAADGIDEEGPQYVYIGDDDEDETPDETEADGKGESGNRPAPGRPAAPLPALINFIVPAGTLGASTPAADRELAAGMDWT